MTTVRKVTFREFADDREEEHETRMQGLPSMNIQQLSI